VKITIVTSNANKAREVTDFFSGVLDVVHIPLEIPELRSDDVVEISRQKAKYAYDHIHSPLIVDDTSFSIDTLNGFPGPNAAYVLNTIGNTGILKIMQDETERNAHFTTVIAFADKTGIRHFTGTIHGTIVTTPRGSGGFGYDSIFETEGQTLAEIPIHEKNKISHRAIALSAFRDWVKQEFKTFDSDANG
jgi:XTP/dITP diphosphohydrolase